MAAPGLRARLVAAFVAIAALTTLVASLLTSFGLHERFDAYVETRTQDAASTSVSRAEAAYAESRGWTSRGIDLLAHELVLTGYDFRLLSGERVLLDTTKLRPPTSEFRQAAELPVRGPDGGRVGTLQLFALGSGGSLAADDALRRELDRAHLIAAAIAAIVAIIAGLIVAGRLAGPLQRLATAARGLGSGRRPPPLPSSGSREVRELAQAVTGLAEDLERQQRARRQLAQDLSHELRTPLTLIQSRIEAMQDGVVPFDTAGLATLHTETLRLGRLIGQIERLAEAEAHPQTMSLETIRLDHIARDARQALAASFELRNLRLLVDAPPTEAIADRDAATQIVMNLLSNALKYTPAGGEVRMTTSSDGRTATLRVHDSGGGLSHEEGERLFARFHRGVDAARTSGGAGLGLTIARELALAQGGGLEVEDVHEGTCFALRIPAPAEGAGTAAVHRTVSPSTGATNGAHDGERAARI